MSIDILNVSKNFGNFSALERVNLQIASGELVALLGPSGCGKTTLLRIIAGLEELDEGKIIFHGEDKTSDSARNRRVGFVFQHYALFRHMNVFENVAFGLKVRPRKSRLARNEMENKVNQLLKLVQMDKFSRHYPLQLSGGQRQRIALARALAVEPKVLLLDEPFGALDAKVRKELRQWLRHLHDQIHLTSIFVTHDQEEALEVADRVVVMNEGRIEQIGTPEEVYDNPASSFVYRFLGDVNQFPAQIRNDEGWIGSSRFPLPEHYRNSDSPLVGYARPHEIDIKKYQTGSLSFEAMISHVQTVGPLVHLELTKCGTGEPFEAKLSKEHFQELDFKNGEKVSVGIRRIKFFVQG
jgi:sulfate/thiosulfate transport system ATP-binding protein